MRLVGGVVRWAGARLMGTKRWSTMCPWTVALGRHGDGDRRRHAGRREAGLGQSVELLPVTPGTVAARERGKTEMGARGTDSSTHLG
jgi:alkylation response protein AidB-like acyl-CoA dehydrogenase